MSYEQAIQAIEKGSYTTASEDQLRQLLQACLAIHGSNPMGQILHDCARTTAAVRRAIQYSQESLIALAERYAIKPKTVHKWRMHGCAQGPIRAS